MEKKTTRKVGSMIVALPLFGMVGLSVAPSAQAEDGASVGEDEHGACIKTYEDPPDVTIDWESCKRLLPTNVTIPP